MNRLFILIFIFCSGIIHAAAPLNSYVFFANSRMNGPYYFSKVTYTNGSYIFNQNKKIIADDGLFHTPGNSLKFQCINATDGDWNGIIYYNPLRGIDHFKPVKYLSFYVYSEQRLKLPSLKLMHADSSFTKTVDYAKAIEAKEWKRVVIPLADFNGTTKNPEKWIGLSFSQNVADGSNINFHADDIEFISEMPAEGVPSEVKIDSAKGYYRHADIHWTLPEGSTAKFIKIYRSTDSKNYKAVGVQDPVMEIFTDFTGIPDQKYWYKISALGFNYNESALSEPVQTATKVFTDEELLTMVQQACFRYYWQGAEKASGLALENIPGRKNMIATGASGFGLMSVVVAMERNFITRKQGVERLQKVMAFLEKADKFHGAIPHFIDGPTGNVEPFFGGKDNGADLVETSFFAQGLLAVRAYLNPANPVEKKMISSITKFWEGIEWSWFKQKPGSKYLYWHWSPDQAWVINHPLIGFNETMVTYMLAISSPTHAVPASMYYTGFASQEEFAQKYRGWGDSPNGIMYSNGNVFHGIKLPVGVSNGGPLFFTHYSYIGWDPKSITDKYTNYFDNNKAIAEINYRYSLQNPKNEPGIGSDGWGFTASIGPDYYSPDEPMIDQEYGKITPTGAVASMPYLPKESLSALKNYYNNYGSFLWGEYGFRDAFILDKNWCSDIYMGLNQAPMVVMIENYRTGLIWKLFMSDRDVQNGLKKFNAETKIQKNRR